MKKSLTKILSVLSMATITATTGLTVTPIALAATRDEPQIYEEVYFERYDGDYGIVKIKLQEGCYFIEDSEVIVYNGETPLETATLAVNKDAKKTYWNEATIAVKDIKHGQVYTFELSNVILDNSGKKQTVPGSFKASTAAQTRYANIGTAYYRTTKTGGGDQREALKRFVPAEKLK